MAPTPSDILEEIASALASHDPDVDPGDLVEEIHCIMEQYCPNPMSTPTPALQPMTEQHSITPPPELVRKWLRERPVKEFAHNYIATQAARWGWEQAVELEAAWLEAKLQKARDEELEACCEWLRGNWPGIPTEKLRAARRPKPPTLKEQALEILDLGHGLADCDRNTLRRALEQLDD